MSNILIAGVGNLGSRYLQGLTNYLEELNIYIYDISVDSLKNASNLWNQSIDRTSHPKISFEQSLDEIPKDIDLAIVSTNADVRGELVRSIADKSRVRFWVLEKVLSQSLIALNELETSTESAEGVWVNTSRRMMPWHKKLGKIFQSTRPMQAYVGKGLWGLACNSIHFLDLISWWTGEELVSLNTTDLDTVWNVTKRSGFYEVTGILEASFSGESKLVLESCDKEKGFMLLIQTDEGEWKIDEIRGIASGPDGSVIPGKLENQSEMTARLVQSILSMGRCNLPTLEESAQLHRIFIATMLDHWNRSQSCRDNIVPIT